MRLDELMPLADAALIFGLLGLGEEADDDGNRQVEQNAPSSYNFV